MKKKEKMAEYPSGSLSDRRNWRWYLVPPEKN